MEHLHPLVCFNRLDAWKLSSSSTLQEEILSRLRSGRTSTTYNLVESIGVAGVRKGKFLPECNPPGFHHLTVLQLTPSDQPFHPLTSLRWSTDRPESIS